MSNQEVNESPEQGTSGLTSATQLVDVTDCVNFSVTNTTSALPDYMTPIVVKEKTEPAFVAFEPLVSRKLRFRSALRESTRRNRDILKELSKF